MLRYAVIGFPVSHSKSPFIHQRFAEQTGKQLDYSAIEVKPEALAGFVPGFFAAGGCGLNVTLPHKEAVYELLEQHTRRADIAGAVNTVFVDETGLLCGDNTDGTGLLNDLKSNLGLELAGRRILLLGAGGAVRGVIAALAMERPAAITIANRTLDKARRLQQDFADTVPLQVTEYSKLSGSFDLIVNGTSLGLQGQLPPLQPTVIATDGCCYDMAYGEGARAFTQWSLQHGARLAADGLGMLVEQAAEAFFVWHGLRPETKPVIAALKQQ